MKSDEIHDLVNITFTVFPTFNRKLFEMIQNTLKDETVTLPQLHLLFIIKKNKGITVTEIAKKLAVTKSNITGLSDKLVKQDLIKRVADETDRRVVRLILTKAGIDYLEKVEKDIKGAVSERFETRSVEEILFFKETLQNMNTLLQKIL